MRRDVKSPNFKITRLRNSSCGYILITLMLFITLLTMGALAVLPEIVQQIQRDREEEMVHRGTEYMRAIKKYYKKFGRYPSRLEELENTNQQRLLSANATKIRFAQEWPRLQTCPSRRPSS
jgi:type II secretory pathway pseudopilin PulG